MPSNVIVTKYGNCDQIRKWKVSNSRRERAWFRSYSALYQYTGRHHIISLRGSVQSFVKRTQIIRVSTPKGVNGVIGKVNYQGIDRCSLNLAANLSMMVLMMQTALLEPTEIYFIISQSCCYYFSWRLETWELSSFVHDVSSKHFLLPACG